MDAKEVVERIIENEEDFRLVDDRIIFQDGHEYFLKKDEEIKNFSDFVLTALAEEGALTRESILGIDREFPEHAKVMVFFYPYFLRRDGNTIEINRIDEDTIEAIKKKLSGMDFLEDKDRKGLKAIVEIIESQGFDVEVNDNIKNKFKPV